MGVKVVRDLVHSYIDIDENLQNIIDTASFQRLKRIRQLSSSYIFPSTNHTRYEHSLGVMQLACNFFDVLKNDFKEFNLDDEEIDELKLHLKLAALLHDVGHPPFSHLGEKFLNKEEIFENIKREYLDFLDIEDTFLNENKKLVGKEHELLSCYCILRKFYSILKNIDKNIDISFICRCIIGNPYKDEKNWAKNICINILNSNSIDVDKLDYLMRDNHMTGEIAPKMDIKRLLASLKIDSDKKIKFVAKAIPAIQSVIDSRDLLYLWVYHHHISIYTDYVTGRIIKKCIELFEEKDKKYLEALDRNLYFSPKAITDDLICDDDIYSHLRKIYVNSLKNMVHPFNKIAIKQLFERDFLKSIWKTIYEYKDFENYLINNNIISSVEKLTEILKNEKIIEEISENLRKKLNLKEGELFIVTKYNKFYNSTQETSISLLLNGEERKLSDLLPQKSFEKFHSMSFFVFLSEKVGADIKSLLVSEIKKIAN